MSKFDKRTYSKLSESSLAQSSLSESTSAPPVVDPVVVAPPAATSTNKMSGTVEVSNVPAAKRKAERWAAVKTVEQPSEASDTVQEANSKWSRIYNLFGVSGETGQDEAFAAVNAYFYRNGCSPEGKYRKTIRTAGGLEAKSGDVVNVIGKTEGDIRQFLRGRLQDSVEFLRNNPAIKDNEYMKRRAETRGVTASQAWLQADWLPQDCEYFRGDEAQVHARLRAHTIASANARRGGSLNRMQTHFDELPETVAEARGAPATTRAFGNEALF